MFNRFITWVKEKLSKLFGTNNIKDKLGIDVAVSSDMVAAVELWSKMYKDQSPWFGSSVVQGLNLPASISAEIARLTTIEMKLKIEGSPRADYLNTQLKPVNDNIRIQTEKAAALGGIFAKPYPKNKDIFVDFIPADMGFPAAFDSTGNITAAVFIDRKVRGKVYYTRLEYHHTEEDGYHIDNIAYKSDNEADIGNQTELSSVVEWADIEPTATVHDIEQPLFAYFKIPLANNIDPSSPLGVSVFSRATKLIEQADRQFSRTMWEFEGSELAVHADTAMFKKNTETGKAELPKGKNRLYRLMNMTGNENNPFDVFSPEIRDQSLFNGLDKIKREIEFACNLAYGTLSEPQSVDKTAEEIKSSKERSYNFISDVQKSLKAFLDELIYAMDVYATLYNLAPAGKYELSAEFSDSIIIDTQKEFLNRTQMIGLQAYTPVKLYAWYFGVSEEEAAEALASVGTDVNSLMNNIKNKEQGTG